MVENSSRDGIKKEIEAVENSTDQWRTEAAMGWKIEAKVLND
jgi:hypothetical protein